MGISIGGSLGPLRVSVPLSGGHRRSSRSARPIDDDTALGLGIIMLLPIIVPTLMIWGLVRCVQGIVRAVRRRRAVREQAFVDAARIEVMLVADPVVELPPVVPQPVAAAVVAGLSAGRPGDFWADQRRQVYERLERLELERSLREHQRLEQQWAAYQAQRQENTA